MSAVDVAHLPPPGRGGVQELLFRRLLAKVQLQQQATDGTDWRRDPRFHHFVVTLQRHLEQLKRQSALEQGGDHAQALAAYEATTAALSEQLELPEVPSFVEPAPDPPPAPRPSAAPPGVDSVVAALQAGGLGANTRLLNARALDEASQSRLRNQEEIQEALTDQMVEYSTALKNNALALSSGLGAREAVLDAAASKLDKSAAGAKAALAGTKGALKRSRRSFWFSLFVIFAVGGAFLGMFAFIRATTVAKHFVPYATLSQGLFAGSGRPAKLQHSAPPTPSPPPPPQPPRPRPVTDRPPSSGQQEQRRPQEHAQPAAGARRPPGHRRRPPQHPSASEAVPRDSPPQPKLDPQPPGDALGREGDESTDVRRGGSPEAAASADELSPAATPAPGELDADDHTESDGAAIEDTTGVSSQHASPEAAVEEGPTSDEVALLQLATDGHTAVEQLPADEEEPVDRTVDGVADEQPEAIASPDSASADDAHHPSEEQEGGGGGGVDAVVEASASAADAEDGEDELTEAGEEERTEAGEDTAAEAAAERLAAQLNVRGDGTQGADAVADSATASAEADSDTDSLASAQSHLPSDIVAEATEPSPPQQEQSREAAASAAEDVEAGAAGVEDEALPANNASEDVARDESGRDACGMRECNGDEMGM